MSWCRSLALCEQKIGVSPLCCTIFCEINPRLAKQYRCGNRNGRSRSRNMAGSCPVHCQAGSDGAFRRRARAAGVKWTVDWIKRLRRDSEAYLTDEANPSPHFSPGFYCGGGSGHVCCVALGRTPRRTVKYACGVLPSRALRRGTDDGNCCSRRGTDDGNCCKQASKSQFWGALTGLAAKNRVVFCV